MTPKDYYSELVAGLTLSAPPKPVGYWVLYPGHAMRTRFAMYVCPTDEQIKNTEALLGWGWEKA